MTRPPKRQEPDGILTFPGTTLDLGSTLPLYLSASVLVLREAHIECVRLLFLYFFVKPRHVPVQ